MAMRDDADFMQPTRLIWAEYRSFYQLFGGIMLVLFGVFLGASIFRYDGSYPTNLYTETISIAITVFVLNSFSERREHVRRMRELRERLMREMGSSDNATARNAVREIQAFGWLGDGSLVGLILESANLREAKLHGARLCRADLSGSDLQYAILTNADLSGVQLDRAVLNHAEMGHCNLRAAQMNSAVLVEARLGYANLNSVNLRMANLAQTTLIQTQLTDADLRRANLNNAILIGAQLQRTTLLGADLRGADLRDCHMEDAKLAHRFFGDAQLNEETILPDGKRYEPAEGITQMERFTNPSHPEYWLREEIRSQNIKRVSQTMTAVSIRKG